MDRAFSRIVSSSPQRQRSSKRHQELKQEVNSLRELRLIAGKAQADVATALRIKQPSVSKLETQADMYLSTLRAYVEAIGGELELVVRLRERPSCASTGWTKRLDAIRDPLRKVGVDDAASRPRLSFREA
jgi:predicted XRE-type DNA-binding protein